MRHFVLGLILVVLGIAGIYAWWEAFGCAMRGLLPLILIALGLVALLSSYHQLPEFDVFADDDGAEEENGG